MSKIAAAHWVLAANRVSDGIEVFLDFEGAWNANIREAVVAHSPDEGRALEDRGTHDASHNLVVGPRLIEVREADGTVMYLAERQLGRSHPDVS